MKIGDTEYSDIAITDNNGNIIGLITEDSGKINIVEYGDFKIHLGNGFKFREIISETGVKVRLLV
ncbi:MAG: hypothetical protein LBU77_05035 [Clostridiales bacterium]|jgi:hypothetical protein|nr:hypothetical protein [Clostridiales bacterium]